MANGQTYGVTQLPTLGGSITTPLAISNTGIIAGNSNLTGDTETHAFKYVNGTIADLGVLSGTDSFAGGVNNGGEVVGNSGTISAFDAFSYANGKLTDLGTLGGTQSWALGVNSVGTVVGVSYLSGNSVNHGFSYGGGVMTDLGTLGGPTSNAYAINDSGVIVGNADYSATNHHAFSYSAGVMTDLGTLGGVKSTALGINNLGYIVGDAQTAGAVIDAFSYFGGKMTDLGGLPGATLSYAYGINSSLTIVGYSTGGSFVHAFVYSNGQMTDLNSLVSLSAVTLTKAYGINDIGQVIASGSDNQAYLLTPLAIHAAVTAASSVDAGYSTSVTVSVLDGSNALIPGYSGIIQLSSSDGAALLPAGTTLANGSGTFTVTLKTPGVQTITATDTAIGTITGTSAPITVNKVIAPTIGAAPVAASASIGATAAFWVVASGTRLQYQWSFDGVPIVGATNPILEDVGVVTSSAGSYSVSITNSSGSIISVPVTLTVNANTSGNPIAFTGQPASQTVASGSTVVFSVSTGVKPGTMTARAANLVQGGVVVGYQWFRNGVAIQGAIDPYFVINGATAGYNGTYTCFAINAAGVLVSNGATLNVVGGASPGRLINLSCRTGVGTGGNQLIAGFVVGGQGTSGTEPLLIRASGPSLTQFGVPGVLSDPQLQLNSNGAVFATNNGWGGSAAIVAAAASVGAFPWTSTTSHDSALLETLAGGPYTAQITGSSGDTGVALAEIYDATPAGSTTPASLRLINISARAQVGTGGNVLIAGFVISGAMGKTVLIRGAGPALAAFGVSGALPDPLLQLYQSNGAGPPTLFASNMGWNGDGQISATATSVGAFSWGPVASPDSALLVTLAPGAYTAEVSGASGDTGIGLIEVYEVP